MSTRLVPYLAFRLHLVLQHCARAEEACSDVASRPSREEASSWPGLEASSDAALNGCGVAAHNINSACYVYRIDIA